MQKVIEMGVNVRKNQRMLANWNISFRTHNKSHHPNSYLSIANRVRKKHTIFKCFPNIEINCSVLINNYSDNFGVEALRDELSVHIFPQYMNQLLEDLPTGSIEESDEYQLLDHYVSHPPS